jgi:uncharacterized protein (TIGR00369 family)
VTRVTKRIADSRFTLSALMGPQDANSHGNVHGGVIMKMADEAGALVAMRHARAPVVTVAIDSMSFMKPIFVGSMVMCDAELTYVGRTSMEVRVQVSTENPLTGEIAVTNTAYLVYVALSDDGKPTMVPGLVYETPEQRIRAAQAEERQLYRKHQREADVLPVSS